MYAVHPAAGAAVLITSPKPNIRESLLADPPVSFFFFFLVLLDSRCRIKNSMGRGEYRLGGIPPASAGPGTSPGLIEPVKWRFPRGQSDGPGRTDTRNN